MEKLIENREMLLVDVLIQQNPLDISVWLRKLEFSDNFEKVL